MEPFEQEEDVSFKSGKRRSGSKTSLIFLSVLSFILLVISIVFITLYALEKTKKTSAPQIPREQKYCGSKACFDAAKGRIKCISCKQNRVPAQHLLHSFEIFFRFILLNKGQKKIVMNDRRDSSIIIIIIQYYYLFACQMQTLVKFITF